MLNNKKYLPYSYPKNYKELQKKWLLKNPWVKISSNVIFPLETKVLGTTLYVKERTIINGPMTVKGSALVTIGKYCSIAENLFVISSNHEINKADIQGEFTFATDVNKGPVYIGNNVWCGDNVTILSGVTIGDGAVIGVGSIVTRDIPPFAVAAGVPARIIKYRFSKRIIEKLLDLSWWHWNNKTIEKNLFFFKENINEKNINSLLDKINLQYEEEITSLIFKRKNVTDWLLQGWGKKETDYCWVEKNQAEIILKTKYPKKYRLLFVKVHSYYLPQKITIFINRKKIGKLKVLNQWSQYKINIRNLHKGANILRFVFERGFIPAKLNNKVSDKRTLYCSFKKISLI